MKKLFLQLLFSAFSLTAFSQATVIKYLSGTDKDHTVQWDFFCTAGRKSGEWTKIAVPSCWELQGFGNYNYGTDKVKFNEEGLYKYHFKTAPEWQHKKVFLVFEGSMTDTKVLVNGQQAGDVHQGSFYRFKYDVTALLKPNADNLLEVNVSKTSANKSVNKAERGGDFWIFGGIYRPVYLEIVPETFIDRIAIDAKADGVFQMDVYPQNLKGGETIEAQIKKLNGENVGKSFAVKVDASAEKIVLKSQFTTPLKWSSEFPNLYQVALSIKRNNTIIHRLTQRFGFRTVELRKNDGFYVNGVKIMFKGADRHSFWPETGRTLSHGVHLLDVKLMKEMNMNAVRMSHYPPDQDFLNVCDSLGLYVLDELTGWQASYDTIVGHKLVKEMVVRDVNHPAVVIWDNGNEGGWNRGLDNDYAWYDPQQRIVIHPFEKFNGTNTKHYPNYAYLLSSVATEKDVFFPTEFMHGLYDGGAGAALDDYWNLLMKHPYGAGGFIWALLDEAVIRTDKNGIYDSDGNHAPDGIVGPHREKEGSFNTIKEIWSPIYVEQPVLDNSFKGKLDITNRYFFTNLNQCKFSWKLVSFPSPNSKALNAKTIVAGNAAINLAPGKSGNLKLNLPITWPKSEALYVTAYGPDHKEVFTWSWAIKPSPALMSKPAIHPKLPVADDNGNTLVINSNGIKYYFDKTTGYIQKVVKPNAEVSLSGGPVLAGTDAKLTQFKHYADKNNYVVEANYSGTATLNVKWIFSAGSPAKLEYNYTQTGPADFMGITFNYPEDKITGMKWLGRGPYHVWKNRLKGQQFGVWQKNYNDAVTGEDWKYPEFKGYHAEVRWVTVENKESPFTVYTDNKDLYFQMLHPRRAKDSPKNNHVEPPFPDGSIGFLNAISPIGDKFLAASQLGPQSQQNVATGEPIKGTLWFDFGN